MSKWAPGKWRMVKNSWSTIGIYADDPRVAKDWRIAESSIEQEATEDNQYVLEEINEANAHLIAAAPAMYEALKALTSAVRNLEGQEIQYSLAMDLSAALNAAHSAMEQAEGRES